MATGRQWPFAMLRMPTLGGTDSQASGINNFGHVTGNAAYFGQFDRLPCVYRDREVIAW